MNKKQLYAAPTTEVLELRLEGVIAASEPELENPPLFQDPYDGTQDNW